MTIANAVVKRPRMSERRNDQVPVVGVHWGCHNLDVTNNSTSQLVTVFWKRITFSVKRKSRIVNQQDICTWKSFAFGKSSVFLFPALFSLTDFNENFNFISFILQECGCFLCFTVKFYTLNWRTAGQYWFLCASPTFGRFFCRFSVLFWVLSK